MNIIWSVMLIIGFVTSMFTGRGDIVSSMTAGCTDAVELVLSLAGAYMLWSGLMEAAKEAGAVEGMAKLLQPMLCRLFPNTESARAPIALNIAANFFGMGGAATPFGIEAMQEMQKYNRNKTTATDEMCMFTAMNASAIDLLPMTVLAMRTTEGSSAPYSVVVPVMAASVAAFVTAISVCKIAEKITAKKCS